MATNAPRSVVGLLPPENTDWLRDPVSISVFASMDIGISQVDLDIDGFAEVPIDMLLDAAGNLMTLVMLLSLLPEGFAQLCGEIRAGEVLTGESFLAHMARQEASDRCAPLRIFCRFDATQLAQARDGFLAVDAA